MNFSEIEKITEEREKQEQELSQLQEQSMRARMEYENTLLKRSLEESSMKYEELNKELKEISQEMKTKTDLLETSNEILKKTINEKIGQLKEELNQENVILRDKHIEILRGLETDIDNSLRLKLEDLSKESINYIQEVELKQKEAQNRFNGFMGRKKIIDILIFINLGLTPILLLVLLLK